MVEAVADAELIPGGELMIGFREQVLVMHRVGIQTRRNQRTGIAHGNKPGVNCRHIRRRDGGKAGLVQIPHFEVREVECPVFDHRPAEAGAELRLGQGKRLVQKSIGGVEPLVPNVAIEIAVQRVGAALGDHVHIPS